MGTSEPVSSLDKGGELGCGDPCKVQPQIHMRTRNNYLQSQCGGPRAAMPVIAPPGPRPGGGKLLECWKLLAMLF